MLINVFNCLCVFQKPKPCSSFEIHTKNSRKVESCRQILIDQKSSQGQQLEWDYRCKQGLIRSLGKECPSFHLYLILTSQLVTP